MCGHFTLTLDPDELQELLGLGPFMQMYQPRYNIAPTQPIAIVRDPDKKPVELFVWGLVPSWSKDISIGSRMINARAETVSEKPSFRSAFKRQRCLILADGFFEWSSLESSAPKTPFYFQIDNGIPFTFAGLYEVWRSPEGDELPTCTIITCPSNQLVRKYHNRMPVILPAETRWDWLDSNMTQAALLDMLKPFGPDTISVRPVSRALNSPKNNGPELLK